MIIQLAIFGDSSSGLGALGVDLHSLIIQLITFILALLLLKKYAFKPITKILQQRREMIDSGVKLGEQMRQRSAELEASVAEKMAEARKKADEVVAAGQETSRNMIRDAEAQARDKAEAIISEAKQRTQSDILRARRQLEHELIGLISDATEAIIEEKVDAKKDATLIDKALKEHISS